MMKANDKLKCYRYELGIFIDKIGSNYYKVMEKLLEACIKL